jgi:hypothetical protein
VEEADEQDQAAARGGLFRLLWQWRSPLGAALVLLVVIGGGRILWQQFSDRVIRDADSLLVPEHIDVQGVPDWVPGQLKWQALRNASLDMPLPLDDPGLERRLARAFDMHPWVERVERVETRHPAAATVVVRCRVPVAMVRVAGGLLAIDAESTVLPSADFTPEAAAEYPIVDGVETSPRGPEGSVWGDPIVAEAASLTAAIGPEWQALALRECRPIPAATGRGIWWELLGEDDLRIVFGSAPGRSAADEPRAAEKISRLRQLSESLKAGEPLHDTDLTKP